MEERLAYIKEKIEALGILLSEKQTKQFYQYFELLSEWNQSFNLTGITEFEDVVEKHFVDSLSIVNIKKLEDVDNLIDVGTGAGFPGIPLKIVYPNLKVTLLDSLNKRVCFLDNVIQKTGLTKIETIHGRAEDFAKPGGKREQFDLCVSRAVANLSILCEYCLPYVRLGGMFVSYKSGRIDEELERARSALFLLGGKLEECKSFCLPGTDIHRSLVMIRKVNGCPKKYPRKSGTASRSPL